MRMRQRHWLDYAVPILAAVLILSVAVLGCLVLIGGYRSLTTQQFSWQIVGAALALVGTSLTAGVSLAVALQQRSTSVEVERLKSQLDARKTAYRELFGAAAVYYYALQPLEVGKYSANAVNAAHEGMIAATRYLISIPSEDAVLWLRIWQRGNLLRGEADAVKALGEAPKREIWLRERTDQSRAPCLGRMYLEFEQNARAALDT